MRTAGRLLGWLLALAALMGGTPRSQAASPFTDVPDAAYYFHAVQWAVEQGITRGVTETEFQPNTPCTRAQAVTFLWRASGSPEPEGTDQPFQDVTEGAYYEKAVRWAVERQITAGTTETTFSPHSTCNRAQIVTFLYRSQPAALFLNDPAFLDVPAGAYYADAVAWASEAGVTGGISPGIFNPYGSCLRGHIVTFLYRAMTRDAVPAIPGIGPETTTTVPEPAETPDTPETPEARDFGKILLDVLSTVENGGGYYTGRKPNAAFSRTAWEGIDAAFVLDGDRPRINLSLARPSFCSSACYMVLMKALLNWDTSGAISKEAWANLKPYVMDNGPWGYQKDGVGCWGRANANGPGLAVLVSQLGAGENTYIGNPGEYESQDAYWSVWEGARPGDFVKIFWNGAIGSNGSKTAESGHLVVFLGREVSFLQDGTRDDIIRYWSSNGSGSMPSGGCGSSQCRSSKIHRAVLTRITDPAAFDHASEIPPDAVDPWLSALDGSHLGTVAELKAAIS